MSQAIGRVTASEKAPSTTTRVRFWVDDKILIRPFDIVRIQHIPSRRGGESSLSYAIVLELEFITDSSSHLAAYVSSDFGDLAAEPLNPRIGTTIAEAEILYNNQEIEMPVRSGALVEWADVEGIREALGVKAFRNPIPAGYMRISNGEVVPIELEGNYVIGDEGAHLNIAGISGLATKTSYAMFLLNSIQQRLNEQTSMVVFNVKGIDLLGLDEVNPELTEPEREEWRKCGLEPRPFNDVTYLYPYCKKPERMYSLTHQDSARLRKQFDENRAFNYFYDVEFGKKRLSLLFSDIDDPAATMESIVADLPDIDAESWNSFRRQVEERTQKGSQGSIPVQSWRKFQRLVRARTSHDIFGDPCSTRTDERRQISVHDAIRNLRPGHVLVVDIEPLPGHLQSFVVGDVVKTILDGKLGEEEDIDSKDLGTVVIFADELNKYAPKSKSEAGKTLTKTLLEISERGRSIGVILFGAEQFRSGVHDRVVGNCSSNIYGRTSPVEINKCPDYRDLPRAHKATIRRLPKGSLLIQHAVFKTELVKIRFPMPSYFQPKG